MSTTEDFARELIREAMRPSADESRFGRIVVSARLIATRGHQALAEATEGCAIVRCELLHYMRSFEYHAWHPEFDPTDEGGILPTYRAVMETQEDGTCKRVRFEREDA